MKTQTINKAPAILKADDLERLIKYYEGRKDWEVVNRLKRMLESIDQEN